MDGDIIFHDQDNIWRLDPQITVYKQTNPDFISYLHSIHEDGEGNIWFGGYGTGFSVLSPEGDLDRLGESRSPGIRVLPGAVCDAQGVQYILCDDGLVIGNEELGWKTYSTFASASLEDTRESSESKGTENRLAGYNLQIIGDSTLLLGSSRYGLLMIDLDQLRGDIASSSESRRVLRELTVVGLDEGLQLTNVISIALDDQERVWMSRPTQGMALYDSQQDNVYNYPNRPEAKNEQATSLYRDSYGHLWIGTYSGLALLCDVDSFDPAVQNLYEELIEIPLGHQVGRLGYITEYQGYLVFGDEAGAHFIDLKQYHASGSSAPVLHTIESKYAGLGMAEQNTVYVDSRERLWMGHNEGVMMIDDILDVIRPTQDRPDYDLHVSYYDQTDTLLSDAERFRFPRLQRAFDLYYRRTGQRTSRERLYVEYALILQGQQDTIVQPMETAQISFPFVPAGRHVLLTRSIYMNQWSPWRAQELVIPRTLIESSWFWAALVLGLCLIAGVIFYLNRRRMIEAQRLQVERAELHSEQDRLRIQAISSSLNPHFINNSLYWIQAKMLRDREAVQVVQRLSENIQSIFKKSKQGVAHHSLAEEMRMIENYLIVQSARFGVDIPYQLVTEERFRANVDFQIPLLQIQIHIENAVEHGLRNSDLEPQLTIKLEEEAEGLHFIIEDNGIGRAAAQAMGSAGTQQGLKMLDDLHQIYSAHNDIAIRSYYEDDIFTSEDGQVFGTRVHIHIPYNYQYEI